MKTSIRQNVVSHTHVDGYTVMTLFCGHVIRKPIIFDPPNDPPKTQRCLDCESGGFPDRPKKPRAPRPKKEKRPRIYLQDGGTWWAYGNRTIPKSWPGVDQLLIDIGARE